VLAAALAATSLVAADIPRPARSMVFPAAMGATIDIAKYKGKALCIEFLLTTCPHCQKTARILQSMRDELGVKGFEVVGVATNTGDPSVVEAFRRQFGITFPVGWATDRDRVHEFLQHPVMLNLYMPQLVFIDRFGSIRAQYPGGDKFFEEATQARNIRAEIEKLLVAKQVTTAPAKPAPAPKPTATAKK
jgi:peroxiredoxin